MHTSQTANAALGSRATSPQFRWWMPGALIGLAFAMISAAAVAGLFHVPDRGSTAWWAVTALTHIPFVVIVLFLAAGTIERVGYFWRGRRPAAPGPLPHTPPSVCVQLPMFNEDAVAARIISAATRLQWPPDRFEVQVLDDSADPLARGSSTPPASSRGASAGCGSTSFAARHAPATRQGSWKKAGTRLTRNSSRSSTPTSSGGAARGARTSFTGADPPSLCGR